MTGAVAIETIPWSAALGPWCHRPLMFEAAVLLWLWPAAPIDLAAVASVLAPVASIGTMDVPRPVPLAAQPYSVVGATEIEGELFAEVHRSFIEAGLEFPAQLPVEFTDQVERCGQHQAVYTYGKPSIVVCRPAHREWQFLRRLLIHELAHAWDDYNMTEPRRRAYMSNLDLDESIIWLDTRLPHDRRPGEMFTGTVSALVQGLVDRERFDSLTGADGLGPETDGG